MDEELLIQEIADVQNEMNGMDKDSDTYKILLDRLADLEDLLQKSRLEDAEHMKVLVQESEGKKDRILKIILKVSAVPLTVLTMFAAHAFQNSEIFDKMDERRISRMEEKDE